VSAGSRILVVDDDVVVRTVLRRVLEQAGFAVIEAADGRAGLRVLFREHVDGVFLDVEMPELDGWETLERIREVTDVPICMLTGQDAELAKVRGLRSGADDYVVKPFGTQELLARAEALVRRGAGRDSAVRLADVYEDAHLRLDHEQRLAWAGGAELALTPTEFGLLAAFVRNPGHVLSAERLAELAWNGQFAASEQVKLYVSRLRRKLVPAVGTDPIETLRGFGYRYRRP
jgi:DNA-binding response OmpR family regulator